MLEMEPKGISLGRGGGDNYGKKTGDGFIDRSKVRILLCDNDSKGSGEVFTLLCKCSYQVISVKSPRQVIDALNAEGPNIDIILSEVDLPMAKGLKMLKYIMRKELQRIPVIMMSAQDEVTLVVKCLRLGAADYLVKPLRTNELLNLWTHMWRRRRMLGLTEKKVINCEFDLIPSDPSDVNTNSTMFSDDTDEKSWKSANLDMSVSTRRGDEINVILAPGPSETQLSLLNDRSNMPKTNDHQRGEFISGPKKSELKIGRSSAFFTYVKSSISTRTTPLSRIHKDGNNRTQTLENVSHIDDKSSAPPLPSESSLPDLSSYNPHSTYPYYLQGAMNQMMMMPSSSSPSPSSSSSMYQRNIGDLHNHAMLPPYNHVPHFLPHHMPGMASFPYYPVNLCLPPGPVHPPSFNVQTVDHREAALIKFRQKRKERCFDKKIRYVNRKKLAEIRPRVRGQFVRKVNGIDVDLNGHPTSTDFDDEDEDEEEDHHAGICYNI